MHDIGKVGIPDAVLLKPQALTPDERAIMQRHQKIRAHIFEGRESSLLQAGALIAISHHERFDGGGYPQGLVGTAIPLSDRIAAVANVFDALTTARAYKPSCELARAVGYMQAQRGGQFDPACVDALLRIRAYDTSLPLNVLRQ